MDNFDVIFGANFATTAKAGIFLHYNDVLICRGKHSCFRGHPQNSPARAPYKMPLAHLELRKQLE
ncbi:unnamed protein product [Spirodela intermedia]|uniref:Uncharacterized protein n=1 Tax=Spirodela intermedia TaxID=51605 RepID=A0A7I8JQE8_SPIIN|nr:unnamed protein product [Spirodela intermedia]CAA6672409.1 unnamed protein product [Spirodela intermedia]